MKLHIVFLLSALQLAAAAHNPPSRFGLHRRQDPPSVSEGGASSPSPPPAAPPGPSHEHTNPPPPPEVTPQPQPPAPEEPQAAPPATPPPVLPPGSSISESTTRPTGPPPMATGTEIPPLESVTSGMPTKPALLPTAVWQPGDRPPVSGAPALPTPFVYQEGQWPAQDRVPPTDSPEVQTWMKELEGHDIPDFSPTVDGSCGGDPAAAAQAAERGWWTCGGHIRDTDIVNCPERNTWGVSFDDGPSGYTQYLLNYLDEVDVRATFFVVGSRVIERPSVLVEEYMKGHEISVHTWSHRPLTSLTTEEVVAELGWTRRAIKTVLGVTPTTMRPPFGDIDDRVRAISLAMGMVPIMWTRTPSGGVFDTNDWMVAAGHVNGTESFQTFEEILTNATTSMETGFIVLQHDLYEISVDLAMGFTLPLALSYSPSLSLQPIGQCINKPTRDLYLESNTNKTFPYPHKSGVDTDGDGVIDTKSGDGGKTTEEIKAKQEEESGASLDASIFLPLSASLIMGALALL
ncbi:chitin deacetylase [Coprinopsis cinerea okayama7|uniref:chitin deacetylase n=1 Tax=Coprinopsis cinerea (strain Okayama-7 / 130 / ATCC MYA-4618 / FGSC 9003) TaxID=240176 RepID=A8N9H8_COPC7|nr:chitin deacetylase [Coprinopsis cinerea okayama7\|eukprot:XP_001831484.1 chitin deacetylase [Coprinopsis cinerea okayama7\